MASLTHTQALPFRLHSHIRPTDHEVKLFKEEAQIALFKDPVRTAQ